MTAYTMKRIESALRYAQSRVSKVWGQATNEWLYTYYLESAHAGDYTNCGPYDYHTAIGQRRVDLIRVALEHLGFSAEEIYTFDRDDIVGLSNAQAMRKVILRVEKSYHAEPVK